MKDETWPALLTAIALASGCVEGDAPRSPAVNTVARATVAPPRVASPEPERRTPAPALSTTMLENADPNRRREAVYAIADAEAANTAAVIGQALTDEEPAVRAAAVEAMTGIEDGTAADWLSIGLGDPDPRVRRTAVEALGQVGGDSARFLLEQALTDTDAGVREAAQQMLEEPAFAGADVR